MKTWLKGGLIGLIYGIVASIVTYIINLQGAAYLNSHPGFIPLQIIFGWPLLIGLLPYITFMNLGMFTGLSFFMYIALFFANRYISGPIILALIGVLIGWIIDNIKK